MNEKGGSMKKTAEKIIKTESQKSDKKIKIRKSTPIFAGIISIISIICIITFFVINKKFNILNTDINKDNNQKVICYEHEDKNKDRLCDNCDYVFSDMDYVQNKILETKIKDKIITLSGNMAKNAKLEVKEIELKQIEEEKQQNYIQKATDFFKEDFIDVVYAYDIKIMDNSEVYQPVEYNQTIKVQVTETGNDKKIDMKNHYEILQIKDDETIEVLNTKVKQNSIIFETSSFSTFLVIQVAGKTVSFTGEHVRIYDLEMNEITNGITVASNTNFGFIAVAEEGYGINPPDKKQTNITAKGSVSLKEFLIKSITADMEVEIVTTTAPNITIQPEPIKTQVKIVPTLEITAENATTYQWQIRRSHEGHWDSAIGSGTTSRTFKPNVDTVGVYEYRCLVGNDAYIGDDRTISDTILVVVVNDLAVTYNQPIIISQDILKQKVKIGEEKAVYEVTAQGNDITFTWQYRTKVNNWWQNITNGVGTAKTTTVSNTDGVKTVKSTLTTAVANNSLLLAEFRCLVGNTNFKTDDAIKTDNMLYLAVTDDSETKYAYHKMEITSQPNSEKVQIGETATFQIETEAVDTYKWQYKTSYEEESWIDVDDTMGFGTTVAVGYNTAELRIDTSNMSVNVETLEETSDEGGETLQSYQAKVENNLSGYIFRCMISSSAVPEVTVESDEVILSVVQGDTLLENVKLLQDPTLEVKNELLEINESGDIRIGVKMTETFEINYDGDGELSVAPEESPYLEISLEENQLILKGIAEGKETLEVKASQGTTYAEKNMILNVTVTDVTEIFITKWKIAPQTTIQLPIPASESNNYIVDWGDGSDREIFDSSANYPTHTYTNTSETVYTIEITGQVDTFGYYQKDIPTTTNVYKDYNDFTNYVVEIVQWGKIGVTRIGFANCSNLEGTIPIPEDTSFKNVVSMENLFYRCSALGGTIPAELFKGATKVENFASAFNGCEALNGEIPSELFENTTKVISFADTFSGCSVLMGEIPLGLFENNTEVTDFTNTFAECNSLSGSIPADLFVNNKKVTTFAGTFNGCINLTGAIPEDLFTRNKEVLDFSNTFNGCSKLSGMIPARLFNYNNKATNFESTFEGCSNLTAGEIQINTDTITNMNNMFKNCTGLISLVFGQEVSQLDGTGMFTNCSNLKAVILLKQALVEDELETTLDLTTIGLNVGATIYVPYKENEAIYEKVWNNIDASRIERIVKANEPNPDHVKLGETYVDETGYTVAGFAMDGDESNNWKQYGFYVEVSGMPVDTSKVGSEWIKYTLFKQ